jgi:hypothetical protein
MIQIIHEDRDSMGPEQLMRAQSIQLAMQKAEMSPLPGDDIPQEVEQTSIGLICRTLARNHCDLMRVSSSNTTSLGSSPSLHGG